MKKRWIILIIVVLLMVVLSIVIKTNLLIYSDGDCNPPFSPIPYSVNRTIIDSEDALSILLNLPSGWSNESVYYEEYINSTVFDIEYKEIRILDRRIPDSTEQTILAYVLQNQ